MLYIFILERKLYQARSFKLCILITPPWYFTSSYQFGEHDRISRSWQHAKDVQKIHFSLWFLGVSNIDESFPFLIVSRSSVLSSCQNIVRCFPRIWKEIEMSVKILISTGEIFDTCTGCMHLRLFIPGVCVCRSDCFHLFFDWNVLHWLGMGFAYCTAVCHYSEWTSVTEGVWDSLCTWTVFNRQT